MGGGEPTDQRCRQVSALCHESSVWLYNGEPLTACWYRGIVVWKERVACGFVFVFHLASFPGHVLWSEVGFVLLHECGLSSVLNTVVPMKQIPYSRKIWRELNLAKSPKTAKIKYWRNLNLAIA